MTRAKYAIVGEKILVKSHILYKDVGYPLNPTNIWENEIYAKEITEKSTQILKYLQGIKYIPGLENLNYIPPNKVTQRIEFLVVSIILDREKFGGNNRKIFYYDDEYLKDKVPFEGVVTKKKFVKTGTRTGGRIYHDYWSGEVEYQSPYLENETTHCIYTILPPKNIRKWPLQIDSIYTDRVQGKLVL